MNYCLHIYNKIAAKTFNSLQSYITRITIINKRVI